MATHEKKTKTKKDGASTKERHQTSEPEKGTEESEYSTEERHQTINPTG
ncbi:hypothetical protein [Streptomyces boncukensis]|uniref:Uncharacterized protein n=1 Tax=Streptomyces boncukensis TaxID=2711219 RepID=A0A6G4X1L5_9ACTN|nr:hypothetical protein [Streptomyces boncukensis]NGO70551.1 hypothetical protein [Streptomyces boncukensis]